MGGERGGLVSGTPTRGNVFLQVIYMSSQSSWQVKRPAASRLWSWSAPPLLPRFSVPVRVFLSEMQMVFPGLTQDDSLPPCLCC